MLMMAKKGYREDERHKYGKLNQSPYPASRHRIRHCREITSHFSVPRDISSTASLARSDCSTNKSECGVKASTSSNRYLEDRQHLLTILPEEVWLLITEKLEHDDLVNLSDSSLFLRQILLPQRVEFLFPNLWKIMGRKYENIVHTTSDRDYFLGLRLVCRSWNQAFDSFYQKHPLHFDLKHEDQSAPFFLKTLINVRIGKMQCPILPVRDLFYLTSVRSPFFARSVEIKISNINCRHQFDTTLNVLMKYGYHIWYCNIDVHYESDNSHALPSPSAFYIKIRLLLGLLPNLKVLRLKFFDFRIRLPTLHDMAELQDEIKSRRLPRLEYLQMLSTDHVPSPIFQELIRQNSHVSTLEIIRYSYHEDYEIYNLSLPNLSTLSICFDTEQDFLKLTNPRVNWPLTKLHLDLGLALSFHNWQSVFNVLNDKFRNTLTHLSLLSPARMSAIHNSIYKLNLPNLTHLDILIHNLVCLDFLLPTRDSLTNLNIYMKIHDNNLDKVLKMAEEVERENVIKLLSCVRSGLKSNIWNVFKKLQQLNFWFRIGNHVVLKLSGGRQQFV